MSYQTSTSTNGHGDGDASSTHTQNSQSTAPVDTASLISRNTQQTKTQQASSKINNYGSWGNMATHFT